MDIVFIRNLRLDTVIGVHDWEQTRPRTLILDLELGWDCAPAAAADRIGLALDYETVSRRLIEFAAGSRYALVETLAERCAAILREEFGCPWVRLSLSKPGALGLGVDVGVLIERGTRPS